MRALKGRQARFLATILSGWLAFRLIAPPGPIDEARPVGVPPPLALAAPYADDEAPFVAGARPAGGGQVARRDIPFRLASAPEKPDTAWDWSSPGRAGRLMMLALSGGEQPPTQTLLRRAVYVSSTFADEAPSPPPRADPLAGRQARRRIEGQAYLFVRPGSGRALAAGGALGGSQAAARVAVAVDEPGTLAAAARAYAPLEGHGAEAALGLDWRPRPESSVRVSIERRQRLDRAGRSAWSAYAAGGFHERMAGGLVVDGYAQAGIVGARSRGLFADGALRLERPVARGGATLGFGAGAWAAAQPGARRIDVGPRVSARLPLADHAIGLALEGRFRVGGDARPGSGVVLTLAADL